MRNILHQLSIRHENAYFMFNNFFNFSFYEKNVGKYCGTGEATDDNMTYTHCVLNTYGYKHTLRIRNTYCFSKATMVSRNRLYIMLHVHRLSSFLLWPVSLYASSKCSHPFVIIFNHLTYKYKNFYVPEI